jgi:hypothetical protein
VDRIVACAVVVAVMAGALRAAAQDPPEAQRGSARLEYTRGPGTDRCPDAIALRGAVSARLGYDPFRDDAPTTVTVLLAQKDGGLRAAIELRDTSGNIAGAREIVSEQNDCAELASAMALAISIAVDPQSLTRPTGPPAPSASPAEPTKSPPPRRPPTRPSSASVPEKKPGLEPSPPPDPIVPRASVGVLVALGAAPAPAVGLTVQGGVRWRAVSLSLEGRADLSASDDLPSGGEVSASLLLGSLVPCVHAGVVLVCGLGSVGALSGSTEGIAMPANDTTVFAAVGARLGVEVTIAGPIAVRAHADVQATLTRTALRVGGESAWTTPPVSGALGSALVGSFW